jgi:hypothetical protein
MKYRLHSLRINGRLIDLPPLPLVPCLVTLRHPYLRGQPWFQLDHRDLVADLAARPYDHHAPLRLGTNP